MAFPGAVCKPCRLRADGLQYAQRRFLVTGLLCEAANAQVTLGGFGGGATCEAGSMVVPVAPKQSSAIASALGMMSPSGGTPTSDTLKAAHVLLGKSVAAPDQMVAPKFVLLVTDGEPNCTNGSDPVAASVAEIASLAKDGIKTYVVGYNTDMDPAKSAMDMMARQAAPARRSTLKSPTGRTSRKPSRTSRVRP